MSDKAKQAEIKKLTTARNWMIIGALLVGFSTAMKLTGLFAVGNIPPWGSGLLVLFLIGGAIHYTIKVNQLRKSS